MNPAHTRLSLATEHAVGRVAVLEDRPVSATLRLLIKEALRARNVLPESDVVARQRDRAVS
jgi:hypothetical protein